MEGTGRGGGVKWIPVPVGVDRNRQACIRSAASPLPSVVAALTLPPSGVAPGCGPGVRRDETSETFDRRNMMGLPLRVLRWVCATGVVFLAGAAASAPADKPPVAPVRPVVDEYFGAKVV